jgi:hypothetical protein
MNNRVLTNGLAVLAAGLLASSLSSFFGRFAILGPATDFVIGFFDGLAVVAFCVAIFFLARSGRPGQSENRPEAKGHS